MLRTLAVALALTVCGCGAVSGSSAPDSDVALLLDGPPAGVHAGIYLTVERGFDEAEGLDLTIRRRGEARKLLQSGRILAAVLDAPMPGATCVMAITQQPRPGHFVCVTPASLRERRATVVALVKALQRGYTEAEADPESAVEAILARTGRDNRAQLAAQLDAVSASFEAGVPAFGYLRRGSLPPGAFAFGLVGPVSRD